MQDQPAQPANLDPKQELIFKLKDANNILVTVSADPSVDQLAAAIGLTLLLNKLKKHATAVFSGEVPSTIDFLKPDETLEKNTDSLRDFIIALDKSKADKLRYKVEDNVVKIFITPYKTSITQDDLDFSQGDFNVDVVLALGVRAQQELDQAITAHGRILHDATVATVNLQPGSELGVINWTVPAASSLSELAVELADALAKDLVDSQIATALLTGIVAETDRFSNEKTSPETMRLSAELMSAGANQQLVASQLQQPEQSASEAEPEPASAVPKADDGTLEITHPADASKSEPEITAAPAAAEPTPSDTPASPSEDGSANDSNSSLSLLPPSRQDTPRRITEPPVMSGRLTANTEAEDSGVAGGLPLREPELPILHRDEPTVPKPLADVPPEPARSTPALELPRPVTDTPASPSVPPLIAKDGTLADLEQAVHSPHATQAADSVDDARNAVLDAINSVPTADLPLPPKADIGATGYLNVQDIPDVHAPEPPLPALPLSPVAQPIPYVPEPTPGNTPADTPLTMPLPPSMASPSAGSFSPPLPPAGLTTPSAPLPPPVPPPMTELPPFVNPNT